MEQEIFDKYEHFGQMLKKAARRGWDSDMCQNLYDALDVMQEIIAEKELDNR